MAFGLEPLGFQIGYDIGLLLSIPTRMSSILTLATGIFWSFVFRLRRKPVLLR